MRSLLNSAFLILALATPVRGHGADEVRFDVAVLPEFQKYAALLIHPGYAAIALESIGLSPRPTLKLIVKDHGRAIEAGNAILRFEGRKGEFYTYAMGMAFGLGRIDTSVTFPVILDVSALGSGKISVTMKLPLATLLPGDFNVRVHRKVAALAAPSVQTVIFAHLEEITKGSPDGAQMPTVAEAILLDAYNRSGGPAAANRDTELALPTADQWMLIITFVSWLLLVTALFLAYLRRQRRGKPA